MQTGPEAPPRGPIRNPKDFYGGIALMAVAFTAWWASLSLAGSKGVYFGPGTAPRLFAGLLLVVGAAVTVVGLLKAGQSIGRYHLRGPLFIGAAIILFATTIRTLGLPIASFVTILVASAASPETRWIETVIWAAVLAAACTLLFIVALGLSLPLQPDF